MKVALMNGTSKILGSCSEILLKDFATFLPEETEIIRCDVIANTVPNCSLSELRKADVWVMAFPLFVDGIPGHFLSFLHRLQREGFSNTGIRIFGIVNNGFIEGEQAEIALEILENWCIKTGCIWCGGIGVGGGPALKEMNKIPPTKGPKKNVGLLLQEMAKTLVAGDTMPNRYASVGLPRTLYKYAAERGWRRSIRTCGLKPEDLNRRL